MALRLDSGLDSGVDSGAALAPGDWLALSIADAGEIPARIVRTVGRDLGMIFHLPPSPIRDRLIRKIFTGGYDNATRSDDALTVTLHMIGSIFRDQPGPAPARPEAVADVPPADLLAAIAARESDLSTWDDDALAELWEAHRDSGDGKAA